MMREKTATYRATAPAWGAVFVVSAYLLIQTFGTIRRVGLSGARPPLSASQTVLHVAMVAAAIGLLRVYRSALDRLMLLACAAAAASTSAHGLGYRSDGLAAFRLLSHVAAYLLLMVVAGRKVADARPAGRSGELDAARYIRDLRPSNRLDRLHRD